MPLEKLILAQPGGANHRKTQPRRGGRVPAHTPEGLSGLTWGLEHTVNFGDSRKLQVSVRAVPEPDSSP